MNPILHMVLHVITLVSLCGVIYYLNRLMSKVNYLVNVEATRRVRSEMESQRPDRPFPGPGLKP